MKEKLETPEQKETAGGGLETKRLIISLRLIFIRILPVGAEVCLAPKACNLPLVGVHFCAGFI